MHTGITHVTTFGLESEVRENCIKPFSNCLFTLFNLSFSYEENSFENKKFL